MSRLTKLPLRTIWKHEALDFTQWLALPENLELLAETLGIGIINAQTEVPVGKFNLDILAEDDNGEKVIIENQLETTNHDHLGKVITYASGLDAKTCIWIVSRARQEHEQAINWLNEHTTEDANFFLLEIEAWKIGNSPPAPRFNIVAKPNDWAKTVKQSGSGNKVSDLKLQQQVFWEKLREYGEQNSKHVRSWQKPLPQHWYNISVGTSKANLAATVNTRDKLVALEFYINNDKDLFHKLLAKKDKIEAELGYKLDWQELPDKKGSRIILAKKGDMLNEAEVPALVEWLTQVTDSFSKTFPKYL